MSPWTRAERRLRARLGLRSCDHVGHEPRVLGAPSVSNAGTMRIGDGFVLSSIPVRSHLTTAPGGVLVVGDRVRIAHGAAIYAGDLVEIGDDVTVGPMVMILDMDFHRIVDRETHGPARPIRIGHGVRLAVGSIVLRGAVIGDGARIGPHSVVSRAVPAGAYAEGVPARPRPPP